MRLVGQMTAREYVAASLERERLLDVLVNASGPELLLGSGPPRQPPPTTILSRQPMATNPPPLSELVTGAEQGGGDRALIFVEKAGAGKPANKVAVAVNEAPVPGSEELLNQRLAEEQRRIQFSYGIASATGYSGITDPSYYGMIGRGR